MKIYESLNIRRDEITPVSLFMIQSVFLGIFLGAFDVGANTLFLKAFDSSMISKAFAVSGMIGILMTSVYSFFQSRIVFSKVSAANLLMVFIITFLLRFGYYFSDSKWLAFGLFVMMGPLNIVALVGFWGTVSRIFDLRQGKRIFGIIDTGQVVGVILSSWAVPFLVASGFKTNNLLYISAFSIFISFVFQIIIGRSFPDRLKISVKTEKKANSFIDTMRVPYVRTMAFFVVLSMLVAFFVHYLFLAVAKSRFENSEELAKFLGGLMGTLTFVSILIKSFVYSKVINTYGLKVTLLVSPIIMGFLIIIAAFVGSIFGYTIESASFTFFFLVISLGKLFQKALKDSIESPSLKMLYQSLDPSIRYEVQARVDGTVNEMSAFSSGIILTLLGLISFIVMIHYIFILIAIIIVWGIVTVYLYRGYRKTLELTLEGAVGKEKKKKETGVSLAGAGGEILASQLSLIERTKPWTLTEAIREKIQSPGPGDLPVLLAKIEEIGDVSFTDDLSLLKDKEGYEVVEKTLNYLVQITKDSVDTQKIRTLLASRNFEDRVYAARVLGASRDEDLKSNLTFLMRDLVPAVKKQAIYAAVGTKSREIIIFLTDFLDRDQYAALAHYALIGSGEEGLDMLDLAMQKTNVSDTFKERILRVMPETGSPRAASLLFSKFSVKSNLSPFIIEGLLQLEFKPDNKEKLALNQKLIEQAGICAWNLNAFYHCPHDSEIPLLKEELDKEFHKSIRKLFDILKLAYDKSSIEAVYENLEAGTGQSISFAVELIDTFVEEDIKPYIVPLLEDTGISNKIWALENYFPLRIYNTESLIKAVINRDNNLIGKQAKIFALNAFQFLENPSVSADLVSQLFNTDKVLSLISAQIIEGLDKAQYFSCKKRLSDKLRVELDKQITIFHSAGLSATDRINFFKTLFKGDTGEKDILYLLYHSTAYRADGIDLLKVEIFREKPYLMFIEAGGIDIYEGNSLIKTYLPGDSINTLNKMEDPWRLETRANTIIHYIDYQKVISCIYDHDYLLKYVETGVENI
jgi:ATP:ADP antiporter, AAA family